MTFRPAGRGLHNAANGNAPRGTVGAPTSRDFAPWRTDGDIGRSAAFGYEPDELPGNLASFAATS
jgi:hypothetical protein